MSERHFYITDQDDDPPTYTCIVPNERILIGVSVEISPASTYIAQHITVEHLEPPFHQDVKTVMGWYQDDEVTLEAIANDILRWFTIVLDNVKAQSAVEHAANDTWQFFDNAHWDDDEDAVENE